MFSFLVGDVQSIQRFSAWDDVEVIQPGQNTGVIIVPKKETDWEAAVITGISSAPVNLSGDWRSYESPGEWQKDVAVNFETEACVSFSASDALQTYGNFMIATGAWPQVTIDWLRAKGYLDTQNKLHFSDRFTARMSNTTQAGGNSLGAVGDAIRKYGLVPESLWPFPTAQINADPAHAWDMYYQYPPQDVLALGLESLKYLQVNYEWLVSTGNGATPAQFAEWLKVAPCQLATAVCAPWNTSNVIQGCGIGAAHATQLSYVNRVAGCYCILDHYVPFDKELALNYTLSYAVRYVLSALPQAVIVPVATPVPITVTPDVANMKLQISLLQQVVQLYKALLLGAGITPRIAGLNVPMQTYSLLRSRTFWVLVVMSLLPIASAIAHTLPPTYQAVAEVILGVLGVFFHQDTAAKAGAVN